MLHRNFITFLQAVEEYVAASAGRSDLDRTSAGKDKKKTGTDTGAVAVHPLTGEKVRPARVSRPNARGTWPMAQQWYLCSIIVYRHG